MLSYNSASIIPAPLVTLSKTYIFTGDDTPLSAKYDITLAGTLLPNRGSPNSSGTFNQANADETSLITDDDKFDSLLKKSKYLRNLFSSSQQAALEWTTEDGVSTVTCYPRLVSINIPEGPWVERKQYSISLTANKLFGPGSGAESEDALIGSLNLTQASDVFDVEEQPETGILIVTRTISATSRRANVGEDPSLTLVAEPWINAKTWVTSRASTLSPNNSFTSGGNGKLFLDTYSYINTSGFTGYSVARTQNIDRQGGTFSLTERWTLSPNNFIHTYTVKHETDSPKLSSATGGSIYGNANTFNIAGEIKGLANTTNTRYANALEYFNNTLFSANKSDNIVALIEALFDGTDLDIEHPVSLVTTRDPINGIIAYDCSFADTGESSITNILRYEISIDQDGGHTGSTLIPGTYVAIPIPGRTNGPIIQDIATRPNIQRTVNATLYLTPQTGGWNYSHIETARTALNSLILHADVQALYNYSSGMTLYLIGKKDVFDPRRGMYQATLTYLCKKN